MITITSRCQTCDWKWKPRKAEGPELDFARAKRAGDAHGREHRGHVVETKRDERFGRRWRLLELEITRS